MPAGRDDMLKKTAVWVCGGAASLSCAGYRHDRRTVRVVFDHAADAADLALDAVEPVDEALVFLRRALLLALRTAAAAGFFSSSMVKYLIVSRIPPRVFVKCPRANKTKN